MSQVLTDSEIAELTARPKQLPIRWRTRLNLRQRNGDAHRRRDLPLGNDAESFVIKCRQSAINPLDFSIVLVYLDKAKNLYRLLRCNGKHPSQHTNRWERQQGQNGHTFGPCFHIHQATQRYQEADLEIDGFAQPTEAYSDYDSALDYFVRISGCVDPEPRTPSSADLFGGV